jgi:hypothetical protein
MVARPHVDHSFRRRDPDYSGPKFGYRSVHLSAILGASMLKNAWQAWKRIARAIGNFQARVILTIFYAVLVFPFGIVVRLFFDPLRIKSRPTAWLERADGAIDLQWAKRQ